MSSAYFIESLLHWEEGCVKKFFMQENRIVLSVEFSPQTCSCPHCREFSEKVRVKDYRLQKIHVGSFGDRQIYALVRKRRRICPHCGRSFYEPVPDLPKYQRRTGAVQRSIFMDCARMESFTDTARRHCVSQPTVTRIFDRISYRVPRHLPSILSIDEFKGNASKEKYQVALNDPVRRMPLDILPSRDTQELIDYFMQFPRHERAKVKAVVMDLSPIFRKVVRTVFPNAVIIGDRFHIQRLVLWAMERVRKKVQKELKDGLRVKRNKAILRKSGVELTDRELKKLREILGKSRQLHCAYALKEHFRYIVRHFHTAEEFGASLDAWLQSVQESGLEEFSSLLTSFKGWQEEIINGMTGAYSNAYTEGLNNKIKVIKRVSFGFRSFERFRKKILITCYCSIEQRDRKGKVTAA